MAFKAAEDVRDFAFGGVGGKAFHVQGAGGVAGQLRGQVVGLRRPRKARARVITRQRLSTRHGTGALTGIGEPAGLVEPIGPGPIGWYIGGGAP